MFVITPLVLTIISQHTDLLAIFSFMIGSHKRANNKQCCLLARHSAYRIRTCFHLIICKCIYFDNFFVLTFLCVKYW